MGVITPYLTFSQNFGDIDRYLIDSVSVSTLSKEDSTILANSLNEFHAAENDTGRINALDQICENLQDDCWIRYQKFQLTLIKEALAKNSKLRKGCKKSKSGV